MFRDEASRELFEWGFTELESRFNAKMDMVQIRTGVGVWHDPRDSLWYALCHLVRDGGDASLAERIIAKVLGMQGVPLAAWPLLQGQRQERLRAVGLSACGASSSEECARALWAMPFSDSLDGSRRRIAFGTGNEAVSLEYDLKQLQ